MFAKNPNATPVWLLIVFSAISVYCFPRIKKIVAKYVRDEEIQKFSTFIIWLVILAIVVTLSVIFFP